jgi:anti-anti-sigma regulatory factor
VTDGPDMQITELTANDHACLTFGEPEDLFDLTAAFIRDGLSSGLKVLWVTDGTQVQAVSELAGRGITVEPALASGQLAAVAWDDGLLCDQGFVADRAMGWLTGQVAACREEEFRGLRVAVNMGWALRPVPGVEQLPDFEKGIAATLPDTGVSVLCQYDRERFDPVTLASVAGFHTRSVAAATYHADVLLRICRQYAPPGIRLAGEIDFQAEEPLARALAEAIRLDGDVTVNMVALRFIDAFCVRMIVSAARSLAAPRRVVLQSSAAVDRIFRLLGADEVPGVSLVTVDDS